MKKTRTILIVTVLVIIAGIFVWHGQAEAPSHTIKTATPSTQHSAQQVGFNKAAFSTTDPTSPWVVVNKQHPLAPVNYAPIDLQPVGAAQYMRAEAAAALTQMLGDAKTAGYIVTPASGYRSYTTQVSVYNSEVKSFGQAVADSESARPGFSEHQTGWAMDLASGGCSITDCFGSTPGGQWVTANAYKYGFILRYRATDVTITGYRAESWHFRYVGKELAGEMHKENVTTLEKFFNISGGSIYK